MRGGTLPGDDHAVFGRLALPGTNGGVAVRGGIGDGFNGNRSYFGGVDLSAQIATHSASQPLDIGWTAGAGLSYGDYWLASVPLALSAGRNWSSGSVSFAPFVYAGTVLDYRRGDEAPEDEEFGAGALAGLGLELAFDASRNVILSANVSLGDRQAVSVGLVLGGG